MFGQDCWWIDYSFTSCWNPISPASLCLMDDARYYKTHGIRKLKISISMEDHSIGDWHHFFFSDEARVWSFWHFLAMIPTYIGPICQRGMAWCPTPSSSLNIARRRSKAKYQWSWKNDSFHLKNEKMKKLQTTYFPKLLPCTNPGIHHHHQKVFSARNRCQYRRPRTLDFTGSPLHSTKKKK